jgi:hypothetical protein
MAKNKGGRPSEYEGKAEQLIETLDSMGHEGEGMAEAIVACGIARETFYRWQEEHPEFSNAVKQMRLRSQAWWEKNGRYATFGGTEGFNATSFIFNMKNRFPDDWRDKQEIENKHDVSDPLAQLFEAVAQGARRIGA